MSFAFNASFVFGLALCLPTLGYGMDAVLSEPNNAKHNAGLILTAKQGNQPLPPVDHAGLPAAANPDYTLVPDHIDNDTKKLQDLKTVADQGNQKEHGEAQYDYAFRLYLGQGAIVDYMRARHYFWLAAKNDKIDASVKAKAYSNYALLLYAGKGGDRDFTQAHECAKNASLQSPDHAQRFQEVMLRVTTDGLDLEAEALLYCQLEAASGNPIAQHLYDEMLLNNKQKEAEYIENAQQTVDGQEPETEVQELKHTEHTPMINNGGQMIVDVQEPEMHAQELRVVEPEHAENTETQNFHEVVPNDAQEDPQDSTKDFAARQLYKAAKAQESVENSDDDNTQLAKTLHGNGNSGARTLAQDRFFYKGATPELTNTQGIHIEVVWADDSDAVNNAGKTTKYLTVTAAQTIQADDHPDTQYNLAPHVNVAALQSNPTNMNSPRLAWWQLESSR